MTSRHSFIIFIRYVIGGGLATVIHLAVLALLVEIYHFNPSIGTTLGFCVATAFNYGFQYHLTFKAKGSHGKTMLRYVIVTVLMMGLNVVLFWYLTEICATPYIYAQMLATLIIMFCNFGINKFYTFSHVAHEEVVMDSIKNKKILLIFLLAFVIRLIIFLIFQPWDNQVQTESVLIGDSPQYHRLAQCIVDHFTLCGDTFRTPGYPFFVAIFYAIFGVKPWVVLLAQTLVDLVTMYYVLKIGELLFSRRVGMIAVLFLAIDTNTIFTSASLYSDNLFVALLWASLYYYLYGLKQEKVKSLLFAGILLALAALTRPVAQYYFLLLLLFALLWPKKNIVLKLKHIFLYGIAFAVILSPWLYRNYDLYQTAKLSSIQGDNLLFWQTTYIRASETHQPGNVVAAEFMSEAKSLGYIEGGNPFVNESITQKIAVQYIKSRPLLAAKRWLSGMIHVYTNLNTGNIVMTLGLKPTALPNDAMATSKSELGLFALFFKVKSVPEIVAGLIVILLLLVNYSTFLLGSWLLLKRHQFVIWGMFIISIMYFTFTGGPIGLARFRLPVAPFYLLIGAVYIDQFLARRKLKDNY